MLCNVLIIDTRKELPTKYKKSISDENIFVHITGNIKDALIYIQTREPDLIIVSDSISEPLEDFCEKIRVLTYNVRPIIVALSKSDEPEDKIKVLQSGADDYISEPVDKKEFHMRIKAHLRREIESNLDNKTLLPNYKYSIRTLKRVLAENDNWATLLINIENFKQYIEIYTEFAGDKIVQTLIAIIKSAVDKNDFIGQISNTEFLIITKTASAEQLSSFLTFAFDSVAQRFYSHEDTKRGYMLLQSDDEAGRRINFVSILISVILSEFDTYSNPEHLLNKMRRIKNLAKTSTKSNYIVDRPKINGETSTLNKHNNKIVILEEDNALELLIRTTLELQGYDVSTTLEPDIIPAIFIIDENENPAKLDLCNKIKEQSIFANSKIIITSNKHNKTDVLNLGADLYLPKPYEITTLIQWVEHLMKEYNY